MFKADMSSLLETLEVLVIKKTTLELELKKVNEQMEETKSQIKEHIPKEDEVNPFRR